MRGPYRQEATTHARNALGSKSRRRSGAEDDAQSVRQVEPGSPEELVAVPELEVARVPRHQADAAVQRHRVERDRGRSAGRRRDHAETDQRSAGATIAVTEE